MSSDSRSKQSSVITEAIWALLKQGPAFDEKGQYRRRNHHRSPYRYLQLVRALLVGNPQLVPVLKRMLLERGDAIATFANDIEEAYIHVEMARGIVIALNLTGKGLMDTSWWGIHELNEALQALAEAVG